MISVFGILIVSLSLISLVSYLFISFSAYKNINNMNYSLWNRFPDELVIRGGPKFYLSLIFQFYLFIQMVLIAFIISPVNLNDITVVRYEAYLFLIGLFQLIEIASMYLYIFFFPVSKDTKLHTTLVAISSAFFIGKCALLSYLFLGISNFEIIFPLVIGILFFALFIVALITLCNPKLFRWYRLQKEVNEDGCAVFIRPDKFPLAYTEWIFIFLDFLSVLLLVLGYIFTF